MQKFIVFLLSIIFFCACRPSHLALQSSFKPRSSPPAPDYSKRQYWASLPDKVDAADSTPVNSNLKNSQAVAHADVFFIYPTIFTGAPKNQFIWNADVNNEDLNRQIQSTTILNQASVFNGACRIYVPYYRQAHLYAF